MEQLSLLDRIYQTLQTRYTKLEGAYFSKTMNYFGSHPQYLFDTPHGYWGNPPENPIPVGHSKRFTDTIKAMIKGATKLVDIISLDLPSGEFRTAILEGIKENPNNIIVRIAGGRVHNTNPDTLKLVKEIHDAVGSRAVEAYVAVQIHADWARTPLGWNHGKYIAVDGRTIITGGHNHYDKAYLGQKPIFDASLKLDGDLAKKAHLFSDALWTYINNYIEGGHSTYGDCLKNNTIGKFKAPMSNVITWDEANNNDEQQKNTVPVLHVTQPGLGLLDDPKHPNPSADAWYIAMEGAQKVIRIAQQDIGGMGGLSNIYGEGKKEVTVGNVSVVGVFDPHFFDWYHTRYYDIALFEAITKNLAANKNLQIRIVLTNHKATAEDGHSYSNDVSASGVYRAFGWFLVKRRGCTLEQACDIIRKQVHIRTIGFAKLPEWQVPPKNLIGNHAKFWSVDDDVCYIGSHNMYPSTTYNLGFRTGHHQEWGVVIGNNGNNVVPNICSDYFDNVYNYSATSKSEFYDKFLSNLKDPHGWG